MGSGVYKMVETNYPQLVKKLEAIPGRKTNMRFRKGVLAWYDGKFDAYIQEMIAAENAKSGDAAPPAPPTPPTPGADVPPQDQGNTDAYNDAFSNAGEEEQTPVEEPMEIHGLTIAPLQEDGTRDFEDMKKLYYGTDELGLTEDIFVEKANGMADDDGVTYATKYADKQDFCRLATVGEIYALINDFKPVS